MIQELWRWNTIVESHFDSTSIHYTILADSTIAKEVPELWRHYVEVKIFV